MPVAESPKLLFLLATLVPGGLFFLQVFGFEFWLRAQIRDRYDRHEDRKWKERTEERLIGAPLAALGLGLAVVLSFLSPNSAVAAFRPSDGSSLVLALGTVVFAFGFLWWLVYSLHASYPRRSKEDASLESLPGFNASEVQDWCINGLGFVSYTLSLIAGFWEVAYRTVVGWIYAA